MNKDFSKGFLDNFKGLSQLVFSQQVSFNPPPNHIPVTYILQREKITFIFFLFRFHGAIFAKYKHCKNNVNSKFIENGKTFPSKEAMYAYCEIFCKQRNESSFKHFILENFLETKTFKSFNLQKNVIFMQKTTTYKDKQMMSFNVSMSTTKITQIKEKVHKN